MLHIQSLKYSLAKEDVLFENIHLHLSSQQKAALIAPNGTGKSTLLQLINGTLIPEEGEIQKPSNCWMVPQQMDTCFHLSLAEFLKIDRKLHALHQILDGKMDDELLCTLDDDWMLEERIDEALTYWGLTSLNLQQKMETLSGGQRTRLALAGIKIHEAELILMDEPSNHLDTKGREQLYRYITSSKETLLIVSHDRQLLEQLDTLYEPNKTGIRAYHGNYTFYKQQKEIESASLNAQIHEQEKSLRLARQKERETLERQNKRNARGKKQQAQAGTPKVVMNLLKNRSENSTSELRNIHTHKIQGIGDELNELRNKVPDIDKIRFNLPNSSLHQGKLLIEAKEIQFAYSQNLWMNPLSFQIRSGDRIRIRGKNGSGKTTLIRLLLGELTPSSGTLHSISVRSLYLDQDYSLLDMEKTVFEQSALVAGPGKEEAEIKTRLSQFLFSPDQWNSPCAVLSGGEKMRLILCGLTLTDEAPDILILDEPTNNLDVSNAEILSKVIQSYRGSLVVVSHDEHFVQAVQLHQSIILNTNTSSIE